MLVSLLLSLALAPPEEPPSVPAADYQLQWRAPAGCPDAATIEARIAALAEGREDGEGTLEIEGTVQAKEEGYELRLRTTLRGDTSERELSSRDCTELGEATALVVAVALEPTLAGPPREEPDPPAEAAVPPPQQTPEVVPDPVESSPPPRSFEPVADASPPPRDRTDRIPSPRALLRAGVGPERGVLPGATAALRLGGGLWWPHLRIVLAATYFAPRRSAGPSDSAALYQQGTLAALGCGAWQREAWSVPLCAGVEAGILRADSRNLPAPRTATGPWLGPVGRVGVVRSFGRAGLSLDLEGVARGVGTRVVVDDTLAFRSSAGSVRLLVGFEFVWR